MFNPREMNVAPASEDVPHVDPAAVQQGVVRRDFARQHPNPIMRLLRRLRGRRARDRH